MENLDFLIIDGDSFIHRACHGYKLSNDTSIDEKSQTIKGFTQMLSSVINRFKTPLIAVVFDHLEENFRDKMYSDYKANRPPKEEVFLNQVRYIHEFIEASGLPIFILKGVEADDTIATLSKKASSHNIKTLILSGDKDLAQLVDENIRILDTKKGYEISINNFKDSFDVNNPKDISSFLALKGDKADNIIGIKNCGDKLSSLLIKEFGSVENILMVDENTLKDFLINNVRGKKTAEGIFESIRGKNSKLMLWKRLTDLKDDIEINLKLKDLKYQKSKYNEEKINKIVNMFNLNIYKSLPLIVRKSQ